MTSRFGLATSQKMGMVFDLWLMRLPFPSESDCQSPYWCTKLPDLVNQSCFCDLRGAIHFATSKKITEIVTKEIIIRHLSAAAHRTLNAKIQDMTAIARDRSTRTIDDYQQDEMFNVWISYSFWHTSGAHAQ
jgi:hypothetical protein